MVAVPVGIPVPSLLSTSTLWLQCLGCAEHLTDTFLGAKGLPVMLGTKLELKEITLLPLQEEGAGDGPWDSAWHLPSLYSHRKGARDEDTLLIWENPNFLGIPPLTQQAVKQGGDNSIGLQGPSPQMPPSPSYLKQSWLSLRNVTITVENQNKKAM